MSHQIRQAFAERILAPTGQLNASANSGISAMITFTRARLGECESFLTISVVQAGESFEQVAGMAGRHGINLRIGAYMLAIERVAAVHRLRGMYA